MSFVDRYLKTKPNVLLVEPTGTWNDLADVVESSIGDIDVLQTSDVDEALAVLDDRIVCIVIHDALTDSDPLVFGRQIHESHGEIPVLVVTDGDAEQRLAFANDPHVTGCFSVTVDQDTLVDRIATEVATYKRRFEQSLKSEVLDSIQEHFETLVYVKDDAGRYLLSTDGGKWPPADEVVGKTDLEIDEEDDDVHFLQDRHGMALDVAAGGDPVQLAVNQYGTDEYRFWHQMTVVPWESDDGPNRGVVGLSNDLTDHYREIETLEKQIEQLERFSSFVSHDLRTPLQVADGYLELARTGDESAFDEVDAAHERMSELLDDLQSMSAGEGSFEARTRTVDFESLLGKIWDVSGTDAATMDVDFPEETIINASEAQLRPLLENLFKNAIDHGGDDVTVRVGTLDDGFYVEDDGPGVPEAQREQILEDGFTTSEDGTGTGLTIVGDAVESENWKLSIEESPEGGARFEVENCMMVTDPSVPETADETYELGRSSNVGDIKIQGETNYDPESDQWTVTGAGHDIWQDNNEFRFVYTAVDGPVRIQGRVLDVEAINPYSKAGFMVRDDVTEEATHGYFGRTPGAGAEVTWCHETGELTVSQQLEEGAAGFEWLRLDRRGDLLTCSVSQDGEQWQPVDQRHVSLEDPVYVGMIVCSVIPRVNCTATFEQVSVSALEPE